MKPLSIALLQMTGSQQLSQNREKGDAYCRRAKALDADIALFPEMWSNGYHITDGPERLKREAVASDGAFVRHFGELAKELEMAIGITFLETWEPSPRNTLCLFDRLGRLVLTYAKVHTCDFDAERNLTRGEGFPVCEMDTAAGPVRVGAMICYDREFPESARILMLRGAEIVLVPNACPMEINRLSQLRARAFENMFCVATANYAYGHPDCNGHSTAFDGMAYREGMAGSCDTLLVEAGEAEGVYLASVQLDELRTYRAAEVHGNAYRRPDIYGPLVACDIEAPFLRRDRRG